MDQDFSLYYTDLRGRPKLIARSSNEPWMRPLASPSSYSPWNGYAEKHVFTVGIHPLRRKLEAGLRDSIRRILSILGGKCISVDYVRIGYEKLDKDNPVVILITVEKDQITYDEGKRVVDEVKAQCIK